MKTKKNQTAIKKLKPSQSFLGYSKVLYEKSCDLFERQLVAKLTVNNYDKKPSVLGYFNEIESKAKLISINELIFKDEEAIDRAIRELNALKEKFKTTKESLENYEKNKELINKFKGA